MKELEALKLLTKPIENVDSDYVSKLFNEVSKTLTPPTSDEVCKALSELTPHGQNVLFDELEKSFYYESVHYNGFEDEKYITQLTHYQNGELIIRHGYKPHLIILIGRFYEGLEKWLK